MNRTINGYAPTRFVTTCPEIIQSMKQILPTLICLGQRIGLPKLWSGVTLMDLTRLQVLKMTTQEIGGKKPPLYRVRWLRPETPARLEIHLPRLSTPITKRGEGIANKNFH